MNDEIKEILDKMKNYLGECHSILAYSLCGYKKKIRNDFRMCMNDIDKLLDYITNLQQENEKLKERCDYLQRSCDRKEEQRDDTVMEYMLQDDYKSRIDKAIEYIEENCIDDEFFINLTPKEKGIIEVLKILKGDDENEK